MLKRDRKDWVNSPIQIMMVSNLKMKTEDEKVLCYFRILMSYKDIKDIRGFRGYTVNNMSIVLPQMCDGITGWSKLVIK